MGGPRLSPTDWRAHRHSQLRADIGHGTHVRNGNDTQKRVRSECVAVSESKHVERKKRRAAPAPMCELSLLSVCQSRHACRCARPNNGSVPLLLSQSPPCSLDAPSPWLTNQTERPWAPKHLPSSLCLQLQHHLAFCRVVSMLVIRVSRLLRAASSHVTGTIFRRRCI